MIAGLKRLKDLGFVRAGRWVLVGGQLELQLEAGWPSTEKVLYAFIVAGELTYIGKSSVRLGSRLQQYKTPARTDRNGATTNINNHRRLCDALVSNELIDIYAFVSAANFQIAGFALDHAAGLEDSLIAELQPLWNIRKSRHPSMPMTTKPEKPEVSLPSTARRSSGARAKAFRSELQRQLAVAIANGAQLLDLTSRDLHIAVGNYPGRNHAMPSCCSVMRSEMLLGDEILEQPPKGKGANLKIRYRLPR